MRRYLDLYVPTRADADKPAERRTPAPHDDAPARRCEHPRQGEVRHEELLINGHHVSVTEDHVGVVELHEE